MQSGHLWQQIWRAGRYIIPVIVIAGLSLFQVSYRFGVGNQCFQIPKIYRAVNPTLYPGDPLVDSLQNYYSVLFPMITALWQTLGISLETLYLILYVALRIWIVAAFFLIAAKLTPAYWAQVFVTLCAMTAHWAFSGTALGMDFLLDSELTHTDVAFAANLSGLAVVLSGLPVVAALFAGLGLYLNVLSGAHFCTLLVVFLLFSWRRWPQKSIVAIVLMLIISIPLATNLLPAAHSSGATFWTYLPRRFAWHFFLSIGGLACFAVMMVILMVVLRRQVLPPAAQRLYIVVLVSVLSMIVVHLLNIYIFKLKPLTVIQPLRMDKWIYVALVTAVPVYLWEMFGKQAELAGRMLIALLAGVFMLGPFVPAGVLGILAAVAFLADGDFRRFRSTSVIYQALIAILVLVSILTLTPIGRQKPFQLREVLLLAFVIVVAGAFVVGTSRRSWGSFVLLGVVACIVSAQALWVSFDLRTRTARWYQGGVDQAFCDVAEWAKRNTPWETQFITPPYLEGWRCFSQRSTLVEWKDGAAMLWSDGYGPIWWDRLACLNCNVEASLPDLYEVMTARYQDLSPRQLVDTAHRFGIDGYVVMSANWASAGHFPKAYTNSEYCVYAIRALEYCQDTEQG